MKKIIIRTVVISTLLGLILLSILLKEATDSVAADYKREDSLVKIEKLIDTSKYIPYKEYLELVEKMKQDSIRVVNQQSYY